jgi:hypothetical protein
MLCDRVTTSVSGCPPGFLNFIVIPLFTQVINIMPEMAECLDQAKLNVTNWQQHQESEEEKAVYKEKNKA